MRREKRTSRRGACGWMTVTVLAKQNKLPKAGVPWSAQVCPSGSKAFWARREEQSPILKNL